MPNLQSILILLLVSLASWGHAVDIHAADDRPNLVFLMADDHALEVTGCYGSYLKDFAHTPTIDRLAAEGMRFTRVCCNNSICSPSRASIISGQYSHITGALNLGCVLKPDSPSYIVELQKAGYQTAVVGKWHMKQKPRGCDDYAVTKGQGKYFNPTFNRPDGSQEKKQGYYADVYTDWALDWLSKRDKKKPFCLNLHFKGPHAPFDYPDRWAKLHEGVKIPEPANLHEDVVKASPHLKALQYSMLYNKAASKIYHLQKPIGNTDEEKRSNSYQHMMHKYIRCVAAIDDNIKRVLDYLEKQGIKDNTVIVYTSDQGYWLGQHGFFDKRLILEETLKMPFIVRYPKEIKAGSVCEDLAMNIDFGPTLLDFAGVTKPKPMQGVSLRPLLQGKTPTDWRDAIFYAYYARKPLHWGLRSKRYKLIHFPHTKEFEFYDLQKDPMEMTNVATDPAYAKQITTSEAQLDKLMDDVGVTRQFLLDHMKTRSRGKTKPNKPKSKKAKKKKNPGN